MGVFLLKFFQIFVLIPTEQVKLWKQNKKHHQLKEQNRVAGPCNNGRGKKGC